MVNLASFFVLLSPVLLVTASVVPAAEVNEPDRPVPVAQEPEYPLYLSKREASGRKTRHLRPVYDNTKRAITLPDVGQVATFPSTGIPQPTRGPYGDTRGGGTNEEIDRQNPDYVTPPLSDSGLLTPRFSLSRGSHLFCRQYSQFEVVFLLVTHPPTEWWLGSGTDRHRPPTL